ncbi:LysR family transcriptional regulator [Azospirillum picis]|uniref:LysR family nitrogen assimilation transcriptional regulator n=1 Tax=Azospirillum picis TaxID=488438 RepID=A0ABU0MI16_9PROT|nr:LysR substrate-binding domain-containing protein [Azospirillum picis]MBP2299265.1 LysR family nitrogen assimilation transcriptional regulator [Azospirillum picis]MDQ0533097.1 LysR family nitrogen assimilation transcriptional regulator [Azospirillum picis]
MDLRQLRYFLGIVEQGSISRAAEALHVAQPALSLHLKRLEEDFGCQLLLRTARGVVPTESGRRLAQRAAALVQAVDGLRDEVRAVEAVPAGPATVGIPTSLGPVLTVPLALAVRRAHPQIQLRVVEGLSGHMLEWMLSGQLDLALVFGTRNMAGLETEPVAREKLHLVGPADDPLLRDRAAIPFAEALALPLILPGRPHGVREEVEHAALLARGAVNVVMEIDALEQIKALVAEGCGYTVLSERVARYGTVAGRLAGLPIADPQIDRSIMLAHAAARPMTVAARAAHGILRGILAELTVDGGWR